MAVKLSALVVLFASGALLAGTIASGVGSAQTVTTTTVPVTTIETTTAPGTTEITTATIEQTTTVPAETTTPTTTTTSSSTGGTPTWVWVLLGVLAVGLIVLAILLARRGGGTISPEERRRILDGVVASWTGQGWAIDNQTADGAILRRGGELMQISVDPAGHVSTRPLPAGYPGSAQP
jgi:hypothetical protein